MVDKPTSPPPAYFLSLSLENVRSFGAKQTISFATKEGRPAQWTIILGDNGVGKTTVLRSLGYFMTYEEPQKISEEISVYLPIYLPNYTYLLPIRKDGQNMSSFSCHFASGIGLIDAQLVSEDDLGIKPFIQLFPSTFTKGGRDSGINLNAEVIRGLVCYGYGASRTTGNSALGEVIERTDFCRSLYDERADLLNAEEWFLQADYRIRSNDDNLTKQNVGLLSKALIRILDEVEDLRVSPVTQAANPYQGLQLKTPYGWVRLRDMSLGYQTLAVWLTDFASKLFIRYPDSPNPLEEPAIVLIDEIDLHLHPSWQRKLIGFLSDIFKNTQFIATAHSPLVVQAAGDVNANVVLLRREGDQTVVVPDLPDIERWRIDQILNSELFDNVPAHSVATEQQLQRRDALLAKARLSAKDKEELDRLNRFVHSQPVGESSPERRAADVLRELARKLGKQDLLD